MALIIRVGPASENWWHEHLQALCPEIDCRPWSHPGAPDDIEIAANVRTLRAGEPLTDLVDLEQGH